jgi:dihydroneopterin aldolase
MPDAILIDQLEISAHVGVSLEERARPQRLTATVILQPRRDFTALEDRIENTVDYQRVCVAIQSLVTKRPRQLIETLAEEIAAMLLRNFPIASVEIELRKFILRDTRFVAVKIQRG